MLRLLNQAGAFPKWSAVILPQLGLACRKQMEVIKPRAGPTLQSHWAICEQAHSTPALTHIKPAEIWVQGMSGWWGGDQQGRDTVFKAQGLRVRKRYQGNIVQSDFKPWTNLNMNLCPVYNKFLLNLSYRISFKCSQRGTKQHKQQFIATDIFFLYWIWLNIPTDRLIWISCCSIALNECIKLRGINLEEAN